MNISLRWHHSTHHRPDNKSFRLFGLHGLCCSYSTLHCRAETAMYANMYTNGCDRVPTTLYLHKQMVGQIGHLGHGLLTPCLKPLSWNSWTLTVKSHQKIWTLTHPFLGMEPQSKSTQFGHHPLKGFSWFLTFLLTEWLASFECCLAQSVCSMFKRQACKQVTVPGFSQWHTCTFASLYDVSVIEYFPWARVSDKYRTPS